MIRKILRMLALCVIVLLTACIIPTPSAVTPTAPVIGTPTSTPINANTPGAGASTPTETAATEAASTATATEEAATPTTAADTPTAAAAAPVITAENAANLTAAALTLPEYPQRFVWVPQGAPLPGELSPAPDLFAVSGVNVYPLHVNPPAIGTAAALPLPSPAVDFAPDLSSAVVLSNTGPGPAAIYNLSGKLLHTLDEPAAYGAGYSRDGKLVAVTSGNALAVILYDAASGQRVTKLTGFQTAAPVYGAGIVPGNKTIYWIARATLEFQDVQTGQMGQKLSFQDFIGPYVFSPDGSRLALSVEGKLLLYSVPDAKPLAAVTLSQPSSALDFSPDGKLLAGGYGPGLQIWDAVTLAPIASLPGPNTSTGLVRFSPDGRYIVTAHENNIIEVWK